MNNNTKCDLCKEHGLVFFSETILPEDYLEGNPDGKIWIIGLNPKGPIGTIEKRTVDQFKLFSPESHSYFRDFKKVSTKLYDNWTSGASTIAHTDLVKCFAPKFPPVINDKPVDSNKIITNCKAHLLSQIRKHKPKVIICNGTDVCNEMTKSFPPENTMESEEALTSYQASYKDNDGNRFLFWIVLSGFIGRIDNRNRRRLGKEIERILEDEKIPLQTKHTT